MPILICNAFGPGCAPDWDAIGAIATASATIVALLLPPRLAAKERVHQQGIRDQEARDERQKTIDVNHEVCSAVDCILAYRDAALAIVNSAPVYNVGREALERISLNVTILAEVLGELKTRPLVSDGALHAAMAAVNIAPSVRGAIGRALQHWGVGDPQWPMRSDELGRMRGISAVAQVRANGVRAYFALGPSGRAADIRALYLPLAQGIADAIIANENPPVVDFDALAI